MFNSNINIVFNSDKEVFLFKLSNEGEIIYDIYDSSLNLMSSKSLQDKNIIKYTVIIDENNVLHLIALIGTGELNYYKYIDQQWSKGTIAKFDLKSNIYNQIEILMINDKLHIIYNYSHLINSNIWTIQHVIYDKEKKERHNAVRYISKRIPDPFMIDVDNQGTIHLLYRTYLNNNSQIYHVFYSPYTKSWSSLSKQLSSDNINNVFPFLFIDSKDNLHGLWIEELVNNIGIKYLKMSSSGKEKYIWKEVQLPYISSQMSPPIIFEENKELKLLYLTNDSIQSLYSQDQGSSWIKGEEIKTPLKNISMIKVRSNILTSNYKIKHCYCNLSSNIEFYFLDLYQSKKPKEIHNEEPPEYNEELSSEPPVPQSNILKDLDIKLSEILDNNNSLKTNINKILNNQVNIENKLDNIQKSINTQKKSFFERFFN